MGYIACVAPGGNRLAVKFGGIRSKQQFQTLLLEFKVIFVEKEWDRDMQSWLIPVSQFALLKMFCQDHGLKLLLTIIERRPIAFGRSSKGQWV